MPKLFPHLRSFIAEMISGDHTLEDIDKLLDQIALGEGLDEQEKAMAVRLEALGVEDDNPHNGASPEYRRGWREGFVAGHQMGRSGAVAPPPKMHQSAAPAVDSSLTDAVNRAAETVSKYGGTPDHVEGLPKGES